MQVVSRWLFAIVIYGTLLMPVVLPAVAWRAPQGRRGQRLLAVAGGWIAVCTAAGVARLFTDDGYYSPNHVTFWAHSTNVERHAVVLLLAATAVASAALLAFHAGWAPRMATPVLVVVSGVLLLAVATQLEGGGRVVAIPLIAAAIAAGALLSARARDGAAALFALIGGAFVTTLVMLTMEIGLGLH